MMRLLLTIVFCLLASNASAQLLPWAKADHVLVEKSKRTLTLLNHGQVVNVYYVSLGGMPVGAKRQQGDEKTPEGEYVIDGRNPHSEYYKSLHISYPGAADMAAARKRGVEPGGDIAIHGLSPRVKHLGERHRYYDWTNGCIAVTNKEMDEIWRAVGDGTPITIIP